MGQGPMGSRLASRSARCCCGQFCCGSVRRKEYHSSKIIAKKRVDRRGEKSGEGRKKHGNHPQRLVQWLHREGKGGQGWRQWQWEG